MKDRLKKLIIIFFAILFTIFLLKIVIKGIKTNTSEITNMNILNYIPSNYEHVILSNSTNNNIKNFINDNIVDNKKDKLNIIKDGIISYLGFNLQGKIEEIYDNEFALSFFKNKSNENDILLIFKLKENKNINNIINLGEEFNTTDQIIELKRLGKLNYISHILQTKDHYLIASSNKKLIQSSLQANNSNKIISRDSIPDGIDLKEIKLLSISKYIIKQNDSTAEIQKVNTLITIFNSEDNKIKLRSFSPNVNKINTKILNNQIAHVKDIIFTNNYSKYKNNINFLYSNVNQKEFLDEISQEVNGVLLFITNDNNWVLCFQNKLPYNNDSIDKLNLLKKYKKEDIYNNNINYSIYTNDSLKIKDNNIIYEKKIPIFSLNNDKNTYISNNFDTLLDITEQSTLSDQYYNYEIKPNIYILNDIFFIKYINNQQLFKYYKSFKNLKYFVNTELFSLEDININISQAIPEIHEKVYLESNLKIH
tara:strand:+ start:398 stop:1837 length:1440 start_codon:yes stop_codon:yes gene_type:complete